LLVIYMGLSCGDLNSNSLDFFFFNQQLLSQLIKSISLFCWLQFHLKSSMALQSFL